MGRICPPCPFRTLGAIFLIDQELGIISGSWIFCPSWIVDVSRAGRCVLAPADLSRTEASMLDEKWSFGESDSSIVA